ncbi:MAG: hypothetical protein U0T36_08975 [Saprospiraceae bacterium]
MKPFCFLCLFAGFQVVNIISCTYPSKNKSNCNQEFDTDSIYRSALLTALDGSCYYNILPPNEIENEEIQNVSIKEYYIINDTFETLTLDANLKNFIENHNDRVIVNDICPLQINYTKNKKFKFLDSHKSIVNFNHLTTLGFEYLSKNPLFNGFIYFSYPLVQVKGDKTYVFIIKVTKVITTARICYVQIVVRNNKILETKELNLLN